MTTTDTSQVIPDAHIGVDPAAIPAPELLAHGRRRRRGPVSARRAVISALPSTLAFVLFIAAWETGSRTGLINVYIAPAPSEIFSDLLSMARQEFFWTAARVTVAETLEGFALGVTGGFALGMLIALFPLARRTFYPHAVALQIIPRSALAPLFLLWFGFGMTSKVVLAGSIAFFPLVVNTLTGVQAVDRDARAMMRSLGATRMQMFWRLTLPSAAPLLAAGVKLAVTLSLIGAVVGEFVGASEGLGVLLTQFELALDTPRVYAVIITLAIIGLVLYGCVTFLERILIFWTTVSPTR